MQRLPTAVDRRDVPLPTSLDVHTRERASMWVLFRQLPYKVALGTAFVLGCVLLQWYLLSIDYVPTELLSLLGLATLVSVWLAALWLLVTVLMFGTVFAVMLYGVRAPQFPVVMLGQTAGVLGVLGFVLHQHWYGTYVGIAAVASAAGCLFYLVREGQRPASDIFIALAAMLIGGACLVFGVVALAVAGGADSVSSQWSSVWWLAGGVLLLLVLLIANGKAAVLSVHPLAVWLVSLPISAAIFLSVAGWQAVPMTLAERVGIRLKGESTLMVPPATCRLVAVATTQQNVEARTALLKSCDAPVTVLKADVELRWAARWLLSIKQVNGMVVPDGHARLTIPDADAQLVLFNDRARQRTELP